MRPGILACVTLAAAVASVVAAPGAAWQLPKADAEKWVARVRALAPKGWAVTARGNDIVVEREKPAQFAHLEINGAFSPGDRPPRLSEGRVRYILRFGPKMSLDEYERMARENVASAAEYGRLHRAVGLPHKFDDFIATTPEEKERVRVFRGAVAKLPRHHLPDLYTPDHAVYFYRPGTNWSGVYEKDPAHAECREFERVLGRQFGMYRAEDARGGRLGGLPEVEAGRWDY